MKTNLSAFYFQGLHNLWEYVQKECLSLLLGFKFFLKKCFKEFFVKILIENFWFKNFNLNSEDNPFVA